MALNLMNLDKRTREFMLEEFERDLSSGKLYLSPRLTPKGQTQYAELLRTSITDGNDVSLEATLRGPGILRDAEERRTPSGGTTVAKVPTTAAETLAEGEFNRFYLRGLCRRCMADGIQELLIYRAKQVTNPRPESVANVGSKVDVAALLQDLRTHVGVDTALGLPPGPNSGLSARIP